MRKRVSIALGAMLVAATGLIAWLSLGEREPVYQGKNLSSWLKLADESGRQDAADALAQIGTNAVPLLVRKLQAKDSPIKKALIALADRQTLININFRTAGDERILAIKGFGILSEKAECAVPILVGLYARSRDPVFRERVSEVLGKIGPAARTAVPTLIQGLADTNSAVREAAASALWQIRSEPTLVVPALMKALSDPSQTVRTEAMGGLAVLGTNARPAIPLFLQLASDPDENIRSEAMDALRLTRGEPQLVVPVLTNALNDSNSFVRGRAAFALSVFGTNARPAIPKLLRMAVETNNTVRDLAVVALAEVGSEPEIVVPALVKALSDPGEWIRANAAEGLGNFSTNARAAIPALIELYVQEQQRATPPAPNRPRLTEIVGQALKQIDPVAAEKAGVK